MKVATFSRAFSHTRPRTCKKGRFFDEKSTCGYYLCLPTINVRGCFWDRNDYFSTIGY